MRWPGIDSNNKLVEIVRLKGRRLPGHISPKVPEKTLEPRQITRLIGTAE